MSCPILSAPGRPFRSGGGQQDAIHEDDGFKVWRRRYRRIGSGARSDASCDGGHPDAGPATVTLGGFLAAEGVYRSRDEQADIGSSFSGIPFSNASTHTPRNCDLPRGRAVCRFWFRAMPTATRTWPCMPSSTFSQGPRAQIPTRATPSARVSVISTARSIGISAGLEFLAGQSWSLVTLNSHGITPRNEVPPATIEAQYVTGFNWARQPQLRVTKNWNREALACRVDRKSANDFRA